MIYLFLVQNGADSHFLRQFWKTNGLFESPFLSWRPWTATTPSAARWWRWPTTESSTRQSGHQLESNTDVKTWIYELPCFFHPPFQTAIVACVCSLYDYTVSYWLSCHVGGISFSLVWNKYNLIKSNQARRPFWKPLGGSVGNKRCLDGLSWQ